MNTHRPVITGPVLLTFFFLFSTAGFISCVPKVKSSVRMECYINPDEAAGLLSEPWLIIPFVPQYGMGRDLEDIGDFRGYLKKARPRQKMVLYGRNVERLTKQQARAHLDYVHYIQKNRDIPGPLLKPIVGSYPHNILMTPYILSNSLKKNEGVFERRMVIEVKFWERPFNTAFLKLQVIVLDESLEEKKLLLPRQIFKAGLKAIADKILYHPLSSISSESNPDY